MSWRGRAMKHRYRIEGDGFVIDGCFHGTPSPATVEALRELGAAAAQRMREDAAAQEAREAGS